MESTLQRGRRHSAKFEVSRDRTVDFMGEKARVYATPMLVRDIENLAATLMGSKAAKAGLT